MAIAGPAPRNLSSRPELALWHCRAGGAFVAVLRVHVHNGTVQDDDPQLWAKWTEPRLPEPPEEPFGDRWPGVSRLGDHVLRPYSPGHAFACFPLLQHLQRVGFNGAPHAIGNHGGRRQIVSPIPGEVPLERARYDSAQLEAAARLIRAYHDATATSSLTDDAEVVRHGDVRPENSVFRDGVPVALIDFDDMHAGTRLEDLGHAVWHWLGIGDPARWPADIGRDLALFASAYGGVTPRELLDSALAAQENHGALVAQRRWPDASKVEVTAWAAECML